MAPTPSAPARPQPARTVVLDSEALAAAARKAAGMAELLEAARRADQRVIVPTVVLAEVMTGADRDAAVWHVVKRLPLVDLPPRTAARAGALRQAAVRRRKKRDLTVDAMIAAVAVERAPAVVVTADPDDFELLLEGHDVTVLPL
ncbi:type II toxin-antitoxin system VapC family toxin [Kineosphaera limosa]|nr:PIN domain-containing protein [Kineosphaera limosa]